MTSAKKPPFMSDRIYDLLKYLAQVGLPTAGSLVFGLSGIWHFGRAEEIVGTIMLVDTFLGGLLLISTKSYNKSEAKYDGDLVLTEKADGGKVATLELNEGAGEVVDKSEVVFKVKNRPGS